MKCPKCGKENKKDFCMFCGYIPDKDTYIDKNKRGETTLLETYLGDNYDKIVRNKNWLPRLLFGPLYIFIKGFYIEGSLLYFLDLFLFYFCFTFNNYFPLPGFSSILNLLLIIANRVIWMALDNIIYIKLLENKLERIKIKYPDNYNEKIDSLEKKHSDFASFFFMVCFFTIIIIIIYLILIIF